ncbi:1-acyl-sn-glycerol-3-phosphate acyltransferase [Tistrella bauzanensis]
MTARPLLFISGVDQRVDLPDLLRASGRDIGAYGDRVVLGFSAGDTVGNARETYAWAQARGVRSIRLVTAAYHLPRALIEFRRAMPGVAILPHPIIPEHVKQDRWWRWPGTAALFLAEYQKYLLAWVRDWLLRKLLPLPHPLWHTLGRPARGARCMTRIRALAFNILFFPWSVLVMLAALPFVASTGMLWRLRRVWLGGILWLLRVVVGLRVEIRGRAHLPPAPYILAAKHQSMLETFVLGNLLDRPAFVLKRELTLIPVLGWYLKRVGMVPIDRARGPSALRRMQAAARACAAEARPLVIFPEGTRRAPGRHPITSVA